MTGRDSAAERRALVDLDEFRETATLAAGSALGWPMLFTADTGRAVLALVEAVEAAREYRDAEYLIRSAPTASTGRPSRLDRYDAARAALDAALESFAPGTGASQVASGRATTEEGEPT